MVGAQMLQPFQWGRGGQVLTPDQVARRREMAEAAQGRAGDTSPVAHWTQGAARVVDALSGVVNERRADAGEAAGIAAAEEYVQGNPVLSGMLGGGTSFSLPQTADATALRQGLVARGLPDHVADAFVLNFQDESGLDPGINEREPLVPGSRGGFGLYQLTGPRRVAYEQFAAQRGVDPSDVDAQLDFLMAELQGPEARAAQSILSAPDTGTAAAAIVNEFLRPAEEHRARRVARYTGGGGMDASGQPMPVTGGGGDVVGALAGAMSNPWVAQQYGPVIEALMSQQMRRGDMQFEQQLAQSDPMRQMQMERERLELEAMRNPAPVAPDWAVIDGQLVDRNAPGGPSVVPIQGFEAPQEGFRMATPEESAAFGGVPGQIGPDNRFYPVDPPSGMTLETTPEGGVRLVQGAGVGGSPARLTEGQSRDNVYATRAQGALSALDGIDATLTNRGELALDRVPFGFGRELQTPEFQQAAAAGREFLQAILRKDTGAAITTQEVQEYGSVYLPQPGDTPEVLEWRREARRRALGALQSGMSQEQLATVTATLAQSRSAADGAAVQTFETFAADPTAQAAAARYGVTLEEMWAIQQGLD